MTSQPYNSADDPFKQLQDRVRLHMKEEMISEKMVTVLKSAFAEFIRTENIILSRKLYNRLFRTVLDEMINDMLTDLSDGS